MNQQIQSDFNQHWQTNPLSQVPRNKLCGAASFFRPVFDLLCTQKARVLDVGCGDGVQWHYLRNLGNEQLNYTGVDISAVALWRMKQQHAGGRVCFIQMDATALAISDNIYDLVFAFGVVAYTHNPRRCFTELCRVCKPGGWVGLWMYPRLGGLGGFVFDLTRRVCQRVGHFWTRRIADLIVPFLGVLPTRSKLSLRNATWHQCQEVVLVNIAPRQLAFFSRDEVATWFEDHDLDIEYEDRNNPITIWGRKRR